MRRILRFLARSEPPVIRGAPRESIDARKQQIQCKMWLLRLDSNQQPSG
jgi:hypothetical protein